jgi:trehalose-6-phosphatase
MQELKKISKLQEFYNFLGDETRGYYIKVLHSLSLKALTNLQQISEDYRRAKNRVLLISYNGGLLDARIHEKYFRGRTIATLTRESAGFTNEVCQTLSQLSAQRATTLFLLSELSASFFDSILSPKDALNLKIACENGYRYLNCAETQ